MGSPTIFNGVFGYGYGNFHRPGTFSKNRGVELLNIMVFPFRCSVSGYNYPHPRKILYSLPARGKKSRARGPNCPKRRFPFVAISKWHDGPNTRIRTSARGHFSICALQYASESRTMAKRIGRRRPSCVQELEPSPKENNVLRPQL